LVQPKNPQVQQHRKTLHRTERSLPFPYSCSLSFSPQNGAEIAFSAQVLVQPKNAVARQYRKMLRMENDVVLHFTDCGLRAIAKKAMALDTGARGLRSILERLLLEPMFEVGTVFY
jgi:hypothetical protein